MKYFLIFIACFVSVCLSQDVNTYVIDKTFSVSYTNLNGWVSAKGANNISPVLSGTTIKVAGKLICNSNIDFYGFMNGAKLKGTTGSATDTLVIYKMSARPMHQIFDTSLTVQLVAGSVDKVYSVWFGVKGDSVTDDTKAFRRFAAAVGGYNQPKVAVIQPGKIRITKTIYWSDWATSGPNNIVDTFTWQGETHYWGGDWNRDIDNLKIIGEYNGLYVERAQPVCGIWFDGAGCYPMFFFAGGRYVTIENVMLDGLGTSKTASEGVFLTGGSEGFEINNCIINNCKRAFRIGNNVHWIDDPVTFTKYEDSSGYPTTYGGWMVENIVSNKSTFRTRTSGASDSDYTIGLESAQCINSMFIQPFLKSLGNYSIYLHSGQMKLINPAFLGSKLSDIYLPTDNASTRISVFGGHTESPSQVSFMATRQAANGSYNNYTFVDCDFRQYEVSGNIILNIIGGYASNVWGQTNLDSKLQSFNLKDVVISGTVGSKIQTSADRTVLKVSGCKFIGTGLSPFTDYVSYHRANIIENCQFEGVNFDSTVTKIRGVPLHISGNRDDDLSQIMMGSDWYRSIGIAADETQFNVLVNAYRKVGDSAKLRASSASGGYASINSSDFGYKLFTGQTQNDTIKNDSTKQLFKFFKKELSKINLLQIGTKNSFGFHDTYPVSNGTSWRSGDFIIDTIQTRTGILSGWKCITGGSPGTWTRFGDTNISITGTITCDSAHLTRGFSCTKLSADSITVNKELIFPVRWNDIQFILGAARNTGATGAPPLASTGNGFAQYQYGIGDSLVAYAELDHQFIEGDTMHFHIHYLNAAKDGTNRYVNWSLHYLIRNIGDSITYTNTITKQDTILANTSTLTHKYLEIGEVPTPNVKIGAGITVCLKRIAASPATDPSANPFVAQAGIHRKVNSLGSHLETTK